MPSTVEVIDASPNIAPVNARRSGANFSLFVVSVAGLFVELMLIRWIGTEVRIFAYLQNTVLVVCFLGLGMGCFSCRRPVRARHLLVPLTFLVLLLAIPVSRQAFGRISGMLSLMEGFLIWGSVTIPDMTLKVTFIGLGLVMTYLLMYIIWEVFVPMGRVLGRLMDDHPRIIVAYSINVAGSLGGILLFVLLSVLDQPPVIWLLVVAILFVCLLSEVRIENSWYLLLIALLPILGWFAGRERGALEAHWSPYQKLVLYESSPEHEFIGPYNLEVNNTVYQEILNLDSDYVASHPQRFSEEMRGLSQYDIPALLHPDAKTMLIVGAGTGNDAAGGLRQGVEQITAVEIDPVIIDVGRRYHPERPYSSAQVRVVNDDARSFFATSKQRYDVISFGLLDSHTQTAMTNSRLDHYVYTAESIARARSLLADGGIMVLSFEARKPYITDRMARLLRDTFGEPPLVFRIPTTHYGYGGVVFVAGDLQVARRQLERNTGLGGMVVQWQHEYPVSLSFTTPLTTDDWPYIYLRKPQIPPLFYLLGALMVILVLHCQRKLHSGSLVQSWTGSCWHFFFLGAGFMLLEVQNISKAAVVLGNTWSVNAVIICGVLSMILVANAIAARWPTLPLAPVYAALCACCLGLYFLDISRFAFLPYLSKALLVGALTTLPMLFSGIVFIRSFAVTESKSDALGANLLGALVGGLLQAVTFATGIKFLLLLVTLLYALALVTRPTRALQPQRVSPVSS